MSLNIDVNQNWSYCHRPTIDNDSIINPPMQNDLCGSNCSPVILPHTTGVHCTDPEAQIDIATTNSADFNQKHEDTNDYDELLEKILEKESQDQFVPSIHTKVPILTIVMLVVGTRGDVQPFIAYGKALRAVGHRVRLATHEKFRIFVRENGLEFFPLATDPTEIMAFLVENSGVIPSLTTIVSGNLLERRRIFFDILNSTWLACTSDDDETGVPFRAQAIIANPISFGHIHCAQKLQIPLHMVFTMPSSPTVVFPYPLSGMDYAKPTRERLNIFSYNAIETLMWWGIGDLVNEFRGTILNLPSLDIREATSMMVDEKIPFTYCWSPSLVPKPSDWPYYVDVSGYFFLDRKANFNTPSEDLLRFLGLSSKSNNETKEIIPPPIFIGFGSVFGHDAQRLLRVILAALRQTGSRALLSGFDVEADHLPSSVFKIGDIPYDWLFEHVSAVCHHGGAGTTADGLRAGKPTIIIPFFGDQFFWGNVIEKSGIGPAPIPGKTVTVEKLIEAFQFVQQPLVQIAAKRVQQRLLHEDGCAAAIQAFHDNLPLSRMRSDLEATFAACFTMEKFSLKVSRPVAQVLLSVGVANKSDFRHHSTHDWLTTCNNAGESQMNDQASVDELKPIIDALLSTTASNRNECVTTMPNSSDNIANRKQCHPDDLSELIHAAAKLSGFSPDVCKRILLKFIKLKRQRMQTSVFSPVDRYYSARSTLRQSHSFFNLLYLPVILMNFIASFSKALVSVFLYKGNLHM